MSKSSLQALREKGCKSNLVAYQIQNSLYPLLVRPDFYCIPSEHQTHMRWMQRLAFEGYHPEPSEFVDLKRKMRQKRGEIYNTVSSYSDQMGALIGDTLINTQKLKEVAHDMGFNGDDSMVHMWQDHAAADLFTKEFGGRICMFGSARLKEGSPEYSAAQWLSQAIVEGFAHPDGTSEQVVTGGGPGIMEAANRGATMGELKLLREMVMEEGKSKDQLEQAIMRFRSQIRSAGFRINLPFEAGVNRHLQFNLSIKNFGPRKQGLVGSSCGRSTVHTGKYVPREGRHPAFFVFKGGFGTLDETWEVLTLQQCGKMPITPTFIVGRDVCASLNATLDFMEQSGTIDPLDRRLLIFCDNEVEALQKYADFYKLELRQFPRVRELIENRVPSLAMAA